ncbi:MAG: molecular chaperone TorD family protein, partial [Acidobacteriota bacterium]
MTTERTPNDRIRQVLRDAAEWRLLGRLFECPSTTWIDDLRNLAADLRTTSLADVALAAREHADEGVFHSLFGPGGPAPPREASYHESLELGSLMAELKEYYEAFGYAPATPEAPDHVSVETGFVAYLRVKEAYALASENEEAAALSREAATRFISDHLAVVATPLRRLLAESGVEYLATASALLASRTGPPPKPRTLPILTSRMNEDLDEGAEL